MNCLQHLIITLSVKNNISANEPQAAATFAVLQMMKHSQL